MFYMELDNEQVRHLLQDEYNVIFSSEAINWIEDELRWFNECETPVLNINLIKSRYEECSLLKFCELMDLEYDNFEVEDMERWFLGLVDENTSMESYLKKSDNLYNLLSKVDEKTLLEIVEDYCDARSMSYRIISGQSIVFDWES